MTEISLYASSLAQRMLAIPRQFDDVEAFLTAAVVRGSDALMLDRLHALVALARRALPVIDVGEQAPMRARAIEVARAVERRVRDGNTFTDGRVTEAGAFGADVAAQIAARIAALPGDAGVGC